MFIEGCTNILASNYNPNAQINDGSCLFVSGCTMPFADNYNPSAVLDDGSCVCNSYNLLLDFSGSTEGYEINLANSGDTCITVLSFDYILKISCEDVLGIYAESDEKLTDILNVLSLDFKLYENEDNEYKEFYSKKIWSFSFDNNSYDLYLEGDDDFCEAFFDILRTENQIECNEDIGQRFNLIRKNVELVLTDIENKPLLYTLQFKNFKIPHCVILDNVKLTRFCTKQTEECILIPREFGFELKEEVDNVKTSAENNAFILNSKNITLRINPYRYIDEDIISYFNNYGYFLKQNKLTNISLNRINEEYIDVRNRQKTSTYTYHDYIYENYLNSMNTCGLRSKSLDYDYAEQVNSFIPSFWQGYVNNLIPATSRWNNGTYFYSNLAIHRNKHKYKNYTLDKGCDAGSELSFEIITDNVCIKKRAYKSKFEQIALLNNICDQCGSTGITYSYFDDGNNESGRLIQYSGDNMTGIVDSVNFDTVNEIDCSLVNGCPIGVVIGEVVNMETTATVSFSTIGVSTIDEISIYVDDVKQLNDYIIFNEETGQGTFTKNIGFGLHEILINVEKDCGSANDIIQYELCGGFFTNLPLSLVFDGSPNAAGVVTGQIYGVEDITDMILTINNKPVPITIFDGINFTANFSLPWTASLNNVVLTAETNCGTAILEGTIIITI